MLKEEKDKVLVKAGNINPEDLVMAPYVYKLVANAVVDCMKAGSNPYGEWQRIVTEAVFILNHPFNKNYIHRFYGNRRKAIEALVALNRELG